MSKKNTTVTISVKGESRKISAVLKEAAEAFRDFEDFDVEKGVENQQYLKPFHIHKRSNGVIVMSFKS